MVFGMSKASSTFFGGDDRNSRRMKAIAVIASTFHNAFAYGWMFQSLCPQDVLSPSAALDYPEMLAVDLCDRYGTLFGIRKDCLDLIGSRERASYSNSEIILHAFQRTLFKN